MSSFTSFFHSKCFTLKHLLHVPTISKNLISVSRFARDNAVFFEFHAGTCFINDQVTRAILMKGHLKNGLYTFTPTSITFNPAASASSSQPALSSGLDSQFSSKCFSRQLNNSVLCFHSVSSLWHHRLGYSSAKVVQSVLSNCKLGVSNINKASFLDFCNACCLGKIHKFPFPCSDTQYTKPL
ncbi:hypothetical protein PanWU01x14_220650 [Parasponia andersonii]|uniref:GAG-pre-integrase domain-containing protein n=1 Tax=Parasponia andersonii TaxID=3476 RepID=A0A2P5BPW5_PARAD|nr:hypothetical protein PanWU01x14_220650 [Parasponia andersonii]